MNHRKLDPLLLLALAVTGCGPGDEDFSKVADYRSPDGRHVVTVEAASSVLAYGAETIRLYVRHTNGPERTLVMTTRLANNGRGVGSQDLRGTWIDAAVLSLCFSGIEQADAVIRIDAATLSYTERDEECAE